MRDIAGPARRFVTSRCAGTLYSMPTLHVEQREYNDIYYAGDYSKLSAPWSRIVAEAMRRLNVYGITGKTNRDVYTDNGWCSARQAAASRVNMSDAGC